MSQGNNMNGIFEPQKVLVTPPGYAYEPPVRNNMESNRSLNQESYGQYSNIRGANNQAMNKVIDMGPSVQTRTREERLKMGSEAAHQDIL